MDFSELITSRYSVRAYKSNPVPDSALAKVLEAARLAPTAANRQPFQLIVIHTRGREAELSHIYSSEWFTQAPLIICACRRAGPGVDKMGRQELQRGRCGHNDGPSHPCRTRTRVWAHAGSGRSSWRPRGRYSACRVTSSRSRSRPSATPPTGPAKRTQAHRRTGQVRTVVREERR